MTGRPARLLGMDLIVRSLRGELSAEEAEQLAAWRSHSPANEAYYQRQQRLWKLLAGADLADNAGQPPSASELIAESGIRPMRAERPRSRKRWWGWIPAGAAVALAAGAALVFMPRALQS